MTQYRLMYGEESIPYAIYRLPNRKGKIAIHVHPDGSVQIDAPPGAENGEIHDAVHKRARWIYNNVTKVRERNEFVMPRCYVSGESHFYLGRRYPLKVRVRKNQPPAAKLYRGQLQLQLRRKHTKEARNVLWGWYRYRSLEVFGRRMEKLSQSLTWINGNTPKIRLLEMKRQWGSCSPSGAIVLNPHLVKAPRDCVDYVICHELCHLVEHNHSKRFYRLLNEVLPEWQAVKARLDGMAGLILNS